MSFHTEQEAAQRLYDSIRENQRAFGANQGGGGRPNTRDPGQTFAAEMYSYITRGVIVVNEDGTLGPGPQFNPNDTRVIGIIDRVNEGVRAANERETDQETEDDPIQDAIDDLDNDDPEGPVKEILQDKAQ